MSTNITQQINNQVLSLLPTHDLTDMNMMLRSLFVLFLIIRNKGTKRPVKRNNTLYIHRTITCTRSEGFGIYFMDQYQQRSCPHVTRGREEEFVGAGLWWKHRLH